MTKFMSSTNHLWNESIFSMNFRPGEAAYQTAVLDQWKMLVETSERISTRRSLSNMFFLAINSVAITILGIFWQSAIVSVTVWWILLPLIVLLLTCFFWLLLVVSYRRLNRAKFIIIHALEELLPAKVFVEEWQILQRHGKTRYVSFTAVELMIPILFAITYIGGGVLLIVTVL